VNCSTVVVTHDQEEAMSLGDRLIVMNKGQIEQDGTPEHVYRHPATAFVADFIGRSSWLDGVVVDRTGAGKAVIRLPSGENIEAVSPNEKATQVNLCIRPEHLRITKDAPDNANGRNVLRATVKNVLYLGSSTQYTLSLSDRKTLLVDVSNTSASSFRAGDLVAVLFDPLDVSVL
jgi:ABC-type Fe3+/spermidine/putrescine transport system ATPase subunit